MIAVDTSVWIDLFRGSGTPPTQELRERLSGGRSVAITDVIYAELLQGARSERAAGDLVDYFRRVRKLRLRGLADFERSALLYRHARRQGITIRKTTDCLIASVCIREAVPLLHADADFDRLATCSPLRVVDPAG